MITTRDRRVFVLDSHDIFRMGVRRALEDQVNFEVVGEAARLDEGFEQIATLRPDVVVVGVREHESSTIEALSELASRQPSAQLLVLSRTARESERQAALVVGARGYLSKDVHADELVEAVEQIAAGDSAPDFERHLRRRPARARAHPGVSTLTRQERKILELIGQGHTNHEIGSQLFLAEKTVRNHVTRILAKLGVRRRTQAAIIASQLPDR